MELVREGSVIGWNGRGDPELWADENADPWICADLGSVGAGRGTTQSKLRCRATLSGG